MFKGLGRQRDLVQNPLLRIFHPLTIVDPQPFVAGVKEFTMDFWNEKESMDFWNKNSSFLTVRLGGIEFLKTLGTSL